VIAGVDIFCGVGGLTHGLAKGGIRVVAGIDVDPECRFPYEANNESMFLELDVSMVTGDQLRALWAGGQYSLLAGCAPCQPFSTYGRRKGRQSISKKKWGLVAHFGRLVKESCPDFVTMENVPQLIDHKVFEEFVFSLGGYEVWWDVIDCTRYGVPQTRKRLVLLASRLGPIHLEFPASPTNGERPKPTVRGAISGLKPLRAGESDPGDSLHSACSLSKLNLRRIRASTAGGTWRDWDASLVARCHTRNSGATYPGVYGRMEWDFARANDYDPEFRLRKWPVWPS
jgi:DNA (cytosine-5)-methyltransferase 1